MCLIALRSFGRITAICLLSAGVLLPLPAILDWTTQALERRESTNLLRLFTGALFAAGCACIGFLASMGYHALFLTSVGTLLAEGLLAMLILRDAGAIERVLEPFETYAEQLATEQYKKE